MDAFVEAIIVITADGKIERFNAAAENMFGYKAEEIKGKAVGILMPGPDHEGHANYVDRYMQTGNAKIIGIGREVQALRRDGSLACGMVLRIRGGKLLTSETFYFKDRDETDHDIFTAFFQQYYNSTTSTPEEILVRRRQLATNYDYNIAFGVSYTFGSIFNNVVNSRFAGASGGVIRRY